MMFLGVALSFAIESSATPPTPPRRGTAVTAARVGAPVRIEFSGSAHLFDWHLRFAAGVWEVSGLIRGLGAVE